MKCLRIYDEDRLIDCLYDWLIDRSNSEITNDRFILTKIRQLYVDINIFACATYVTPTSPRRARSIGLFVRLASLMSFRIQSELLRYCSLIALQSIDHRSYNRTKLFIYKLPAAVITALQWTTFQQVNCKPICSKLKLQWTYQGFTTQSTNLMSKIELIESANLVTSNILIKRQQDVSSETYKSSSDHLEAISWAYNLVFDRQCKEPAQRKLSCFVLLRPAMLSSDGLFAFSGWDATSNKRIDSRSHQATYMTNKCKQAFWKDQLDVKSTLTTDHFLPVNSCLIYPLIELYIVPTLAQWPWRGLNSMSSLITDELNEQVLER